jgi:hypothetical protein
MRVSDRRPKHGIPRNSNTSINSFFSSATTCPYRLRGPPPCCGRSVIDFWSWGAHRVQLRCPDDVSDDMYECGVPEGTLNLNSTGYPDHGRYGNLPVQRKIPAAEPGIEFRTSWLVVRSADHQATRLVRLLTVILYISALVKGGTFLTFSCNILWVNFNKGLYFVEEEWRIHIINFGLCEQ